MQKITNRAYHKRKERGQKNGRKTLIREKIKQIFPELNKVTSLYIQRSS